MLKLLVQREGVSASGRHHSNQLPVPYTDEVRVLVVELVDQEPVRVRLVLRNLLHEGLVVQPVDLLELPLLGGDLEG